MQLSVIIPTLNEENYILDCLGSIYNACHHTPEVIVIDAGSRDHTIQLIEQNYFQVIVRKEIALKGKKYASLQKGAEIASGSILLFVDADSILPKAFDVAIIKSLENPKVVAGSFEFSFSERTLLLSLITLLNRIRYRINHHFFGDQGLFIRKDIFIRSGGWPERPIMESVYFCKKLKEYGRLALIQLKMKTSARRFREGGVLKTLLQDMKIYFLYLIGYPIDKYAKAYWAKNENIVNQEYS